MFLITDWITGAQMATADALTNVSKNFPIQYVEGEFVVRKFFGRSYYLMVGEK